MMYTYCIAEDEFYVQKSIIGRLRSFKLDLACMGCAYTGEEAEKLYDKIRPDLFFVDINMPQTDGIAFIENVRRKDPQCRTLFIIISGYSDYRSMHRAIRVEVFDYLQKPIVPQEFADMMARALESLKKLEEDGMNEVPPTEKKADIQADAVQTSLKGGQEEQAETWDMSGFPREDDLRSDPAGEERIRRICRYIQTHYAEEISAAKIGELFYLSQSHIAHLFRKYTGTSLGKYLEDVRLSQADKLLRNTDLTITRIAERVGYHDSNYFAKCFRKKYRTSPSEVRSGTGKGEYL